MLASLVDIEVPAYASSVDQAERELREEENLREVSAMRRGRAYANERECYSSLPPPRRGPHLRLVTSETRSSA